jgi:hypothetical protein
MTPSEILQQYERGDISHTGFLVGFIHSLNPVNAQESLGLLTPDLRADLVDYVLQFDPTRRVFRGMPPTVDRIEWLRSLLLLPVGVDVSTSSVSTITEVP